MAEVAEVVNEVVHVEKDAEKKVIDVEEEKNEANNEKDLKPKENGKSETNEKSEPETNGNSDSAENTTGAGAGAKRKSGAGDNVDGTPTEGATPEKKAKISADEKDSTNGESEVTVSDNAGEAKNMSYQKHF